MSIYTKKYPPGYYVYMYLRSRDSNSVSQGKKGTPYYVGKGCKYRAWEKHHNVHTPKDHSNIIIIAQALTEDAALSIERVQIAIWGRVNVQTGILRNRAAGGLGSSGFRHTEEMKLHFSITRKGSTPHNKGKPMPPETKARMKLAATLKDPPKESTKEKIRQTLTGRKRPHGVCAKISASKKGKPGKRNKRSTAFGLKMGDIIRGSHYWNNGVDMKRSVECPGPEWHLGRLKKGEKYWNNGQSMKKSVHSPGPEWVLGKIKINARWWNDGVSMKKSVYSPGTDWVLGRIKSDAKYWNNGKSTKRSQDCPGPGWILGHLRWRD